jgi:hypothetical protein
MLCPGKRFALTRQTVAVGLEAGKRLVMLVPAGDIIEILPGYTKGDVTVEVLWTGEQITMFAVDIEERGRAIGNGPE